MRPYRTDFDSASPLNLPGHVFSFRLVPRAHYCFLWRVQWSRPTLSLPSQPLRKVHWQGPGGWPALTQTARINATSPPLWPAKRAQFLTQMAWTSLVLESRGTGGIASHPTAGAVTQTADHARARPGVYYAGPGVLVLSLSVKLPSQCRLVTCCPARGPRQVSRRPGRRAPRPRG
jgi:hypothetical protein